jgi:multidrug efflux pump subunit AcrA (membrane-fusion protein)
MPNNISKRRSFRLLAIVGLLLVIAVLAVATTDRWLPLLQQSRRDGQNSLIDAPSGHNEDLNQGHASHLGAQAGHVAVASIVLSENGLRNVGFEPLAIEPSSYERKVTLPAIVIERPGRSQLYITAPLTGIVTAIHAVTGEAVGPGEPLFDLRLTHEELVVAQREYLRTAENLDVVNHEIARLKSLEEGVIAGRRILEQEYEKQKLEASLHAESQALLLHGISQAQADEILKTRHLFQIITVKAPEHVHNGDSFKTEHLFQIQRLGIAQGEQVEIGHELAVLSDHCELLIEGLAFEDDATQIREAAVAGHEVSARPLVDDSRDSVVTGLKVLYVSDKIDPDSRAFKFYLRLPNKIVFDKSIPAGNRYIEWLYKPGQRMQLSLPVETWKDQLVLPTTAVVDEGAEAYVYRQNGQHFDQISVHVLQRDHNAVVIANNGALFRGDVIAGAGAFQMHLALKNKSDGGIDPHAGHGH